jgi:hypothetical protein
VNLRVRQSRGHVQMAARVLDVRMRQWQAQSSQLAFVRQPSPQHPLEPHLPDVGKRGHKVAVAQRHALQVSMAGVSGSGGGQRRLLLRLLRADV